MASKGNITLNTVINDNSEIIEYNNQMDKFGDWLNSKKAHYDERYYELKEMLPDMNDETISSYLQEMASFSGEEADHFVDTLRKLGYNSITPMDEEIEIFLDNQLLRVDSSLLKLMNEGKLNVKPEEFFQYYAEEYPKIYKYYPGVTQFLSEDIGEDGGYYDSNDLTIYGINMFKPSREYSASNWRNVLEHEGSHKVDCLSGRSNLRLSDHPYFRELSLRQSASEYSRGYMNHSDSVQRSKYFTENLACAVMTVPMAEKFPSKALAMNPVEGSGHEITLNGITYTVAGDVPYSEYQSVNRELDNVVRKFRSVETPREFLDYLDGLQS